MAITTLDGLVSAMLPATDFFKIGTAMKAAGGLQSTFYYAGSPSAAAASAAGLAGEALTSFAGQIPFPAAVGGKEVRLARLAFAQSSSLGHLTVCDRLWHNNGFVVTSTAAQDINSVTLPARDKNGSVNGEGVMLAMEVITVLGAGTPTFTVSYTNSAGTSGRSGTIGPILTTSSVGTFYKMQLASGDTGVKSVQQITSSATMTSGTVAFVLYRPIASIATPNVNVGFTQDAVALGMPRAFDSTVPFLTGQCIATTATTVDGLITWAQG